MTDDEARRVAREAVHETLQMLGIDVDDPHEMQRDFQFIRSWRGSSEAVKRQGFLTAIGVITAGILGLIWMAVTK